VSPGPSSRARTPAAGAQQASAAGHGQAGGSCLKNAMRAEETETNALAHGGAAEGYCRALSYSEKPVPTLVGVQDASMARGAAYGEQQDARGCQDDAKGEGDFRRRARRRVLGTPEPE
jgi:hypothetical protein